MRRNCFSINEKELRNYLNIFYQKGGASVFKRILNSPDAAEEFLRHPDGIYDRYVLEKGQPSPLMRQGKHIPFDKTDQRHMDALLADIAVIGANYWIRQQSQKSP